MEAKASRGVLVVGFVRESDRVSGSRRRRAYELRCHHAPPGREAREKGDKERVFFDEVLPDVEQRENHQRQERQ